MTHSFVTLCSILSMELYQLLMLLYHLDIVHRLPVTLKMTLPSL